jgi:diphthamide biosynthesis protein 2
MPGIDPEQFQFSATAAFLSPYKRAALQLPDALLPLAFDLVNQLRAQTSCDLVVLADTTYGSCCVDEVAAMHANAEAVVHYGQSCLSRPSKLPALLVFAESPLLHHDSAHRPEHLFRNISPADVPSSAQVLCDVQCHQLAVSFARHFHLREPAEPPTVLEPVDAAPTPAASHEAAPKASPPPGIIYVGYPAAHLDQLALQHAQVHFVNAQHRPNLTLKPHVPAMSKSLARRFVLIEKAKAAKVVGILVGTLSSAGFVKAVDRVRAVVENAGLKAYVFLMGKINAQKLGNFAEVDVFCLVACPLNSFIDSKEFAKPVVTPFELERALTKRGEQATLGAFDFGALLMEPMFEPHEDPVFSLATGQLVQPMKKDLQVALKYSSPAADLLALRSFRGLDPAQDVQAERARPGQDGRAWQLRGRDDGKLL